VRRAAARDLHARARALPTQMFEVDEEVANESITIRNMIEGELARAARATGP
jgi:hypothetical protein